MTTWFQVYQSSPSPFYFPPSWLLSRCPELPWWDRLGPLGCFLQLACLLQTWKKFVSFRDPSLEFIIISAKYPTKNQQFRHFTQIDDWFLLQNCQNTLYFITLSTKDVLFLLKTSILLQLWKKFPQLYRNFRDPGSRGSRVFACLVE